MIVKKFDGHPGFVAIEGLPVMLVAFLGPETEALLPEAIRRISDCDHDPRGMLAVLVPPRPAPEDGDRDDGPVDSFVVSGPPAETLRSAVLADDVPERPLFDLLRQAFEGGIGGVEVLSGEAADTLQECPFTIEGILPHRGPLSFLRASAGSLLRQPGLTSLAVGFDQLPPEDISSFGGHERVRLLAFHPEPVGPYVVRQHCALTSQCDVLAMQDSDDLSTMSRLARQATHLQRTRADIVGCHELRVDERAGTVRAHRYPLDGNKALATKLGYVCLMGAMMIPKQILRAVGGFSTVRRIASDTQFLWRAHFTARIRNVDAFLYIRRIWQGSLTVAPETGINAPERTELRQAWRSAFDAVAAGRATCANTALAAEQREDEVLVRDLRTHVVRPAILSPDQAGRTEPRQLKRQSLFRKMLRELHRALVGKSTRLQNHTPDLANDFVLLRILGNDLPPRHEAGQTVENLRFTLQNEGPLAGCIKVWILNRIVCPNVEAELIRLLENHGQRYVRIPFEADAYGQTGWSFAHTTKTGFLHGEVWDARTEQERERILEKTYEFKNLYVMNNNGARNHALTLGRSMARWVLPFDGNCFFTASAWDRLRADVLARPDLPYFIVPMARVVDNAVLLDPGYTAEATHEPQIVFRSDAPETFNERYRYGTRPKVELLMRLGVPGIWDGLMIDPWEPRRPELSSDAGGFASAGWVARLSSGRPDQEGVGVEATRARNLARRAAILTMIDRLDEGQLRQELAAALSAANVECNGTGRSERGGETSEHRSAPTLPKEFLDAVRALILAWVRLGDETGAARAATAAVRTWLVNEDTRMDPSKFPSAVKTERLHRFVHAVHILRHTRGFSVDEEEMVHTWLRHHADQPDVGDTKSSAKPVTDDAGGGLDLRRLFMATYHDDARSIISLLKVNDYRLFLASGEDGE